MDVQRAEMNIKNLVNLKYINLNSCVWLTDDLMTKIAALPAIQSINVGSTNVSNASNTALKSVVKRLRALHVGFTKIKGAALV